MVRLKLVPILLKGPIVKIDRNAVKTPLRQWSLKVVHDAGEYPPQKPTVSGYVRKGSGGLGGAWTTSGPSIFGNDVVTEVGNRMEYAGYVVGYGPAASAPKDQKQTREMERRDWPRVDEVAERVFNEHTRPALDRVFAGKG